MLVSKSKIKLFLKLLVSVLLMGFLVSKLDWSNGFKLIRNANGWYLALAVVLLTVERLLSVYKWHLLLLFKKAAVSYWRLFIINYIGGFFGLVLPSSVSADVVRGYYLSKSTSDVKLAVTSMLVDRIMGALSLVFFGCLSAWMVGDRLGFSHQRLIVGAVGVLSIIGVMLLQNERFLRWVDQVLIQRLTAWNIHHHLRKWSKSCLEYGHHPVLMMWSFLLSVLVQAVRVMIFYVVALGFDVHVSAVYYFIFIPLIMLVIMLPVAINGFGLREGTFVALFTMVGMSQADSTVIVFTVTILTTLTTAVGGIIYLLDKGHKRPGPTGGVTSPMPAHKGGRSGS